MWSICLMNIWWIYYSYIYRYEVGASGQLQQRPHRTSPQATQVVAQIGSDCNSNVFPWPWLISLTAKNISRHKQTKCKPTLYGCYRIIGLTLSLETRFVHTLLKRGSHHLSIVCWHARIIQRCKPAWSLGGSADLGRRAFANCCNFVVHIAILTAAMSKGLRRINFMFGDAKALKYSKLSDFFAPALGAMRSKPNSPCRFASIRCTRSKSGKSSVCLCVRWRMRRTCWICWHRDIPRLS